MSSAVMDMFLSLYTSLTAVTILSEMLLNSDSALPEKSDAVAFQRSCDANAVAENMNIIESVNKQVIIFFIFVTSVSAK